MAEEGWFWRRRHEVACRFRVLVRLGKPIADSDDIFGARHCFYWNHACVRKEVQDDHNAAIWPISSPIGHNTIC